MFITRPLPALLGLVLFAGCSKEAADNSRPTHVPQGYPSLPAQPFDYTSLNLPAFWLTNVSPPGAAPTSVAGMDNTPPTNPITDAGATLGRVLFYDNKLSKNGSVSCSSCHKQEDGFADNTTLSLGFEGGTTRRHSMGLINARFYQRGRFFWDERAATLEDQVLMPFQDATEMGLTLSQLDSLVEAQPYYAPLFEDAFGDPDITTDRISKALAQFVRSIVSYSSKYDQGRAQVATITVPFPNFTASENLGKDLFIRPVANGGAGCFGCHNTEAFINTAAGPRNNGLDAFSSTDFGAYETFVNMPMLQGAFKVGSLRNIALSPPYMHDGRLATLEDVVEHYNSGIQDHPQLDPVLRDGNGDPLRLNLTPAEKQALADFLHTLTDASVALEEKWSNPF